jgi:hypothetical protein
MDRDGIGFALGIRSCHWFAETANQRIHDIHDPRLDDVLP